MITNLKRHLFAALLILLAAVGFTAAAYGYEVSPLRVFLEPQNGRKSATISVNNVRDEDLFVEVRALRRIVTQDGSQTLEPVDDKFIIFPPQRKIAPKTSQAVRIQFVGPPPLDQSESYVIQVVEVPVDKPGFSGVRFTYNFGVAVYVDSPKASADLQPPVARAADGKLLLSVRNDGDAYGFTVGHALRYTAGGETIMIEPAALAELIEMPIIPPHSQRDFVIAQPGIPDGPVTDVALIDRTQ